VCVCSANIDILYTANFEDGVPDGTPPVSAVQPIRAFNLASNLVCCHSVVGVATTGLGLHQRQRCWPMIQSTGACCR
jgi:hypothetical protein